MNPSGLPLQYGHLWDYSKCPYIRGDFVHNLCLWDQRKCPDKIISEVSLLRNVPLFYYDKSIAHSIAWNKCIMIEISAYTLNV
jgi:hypothetical protein